MCGATTPHDWSWSMEYRGRTDLGPASNADVVAFYEGLGFRVEQRISMGRRLEGAG
jgi:hypothetical protein